MKIDINEILMQTIKHNIAESIDKLIKENVDQFHKQLVDRKDSYIAEVMKGIRIFHENSELGNYVNYKIQFENITRIEK